MVALIPASPLVERFAAYTRELQDRIVAALAAVEPAPFARRDWERPQGGGGHMATVRGEAIEKGAVLWSRVHGDSNPLTGKPFQACGLSLILHPSSARAPSVHLNVRRFEEEGDAWWGGGTDLTPMGVRHEDDVAHFHAVLRRALGERYGPGHEEAKRYFFVPHRGRERGAGGVFYDQVREDDDALVRRIGDSFLDAYLPILQKRAREPTTPDERERQLVDRGVYVEFNLLYDRGTRFGFQSGGNPDAILASLPPLVRW